MKRLWPHWARARDRGRAGSISLIAVLALLPVAGFFYFSMNTGQVTDDRRVAQHAADSLAQMHGAWTARSLNMIAMNNVEAAQLLSLAIGSEALIDAMDELQARAVGMITYITLHGVKHCVKFRFPPAIGACFAHHYRSSRPALQALRRISSIKRRYDPENGRDIAHRGLRAIDAMNRKIAERHAAAVGQMAVSFAEDFGLASHHYVDPCRNAESRDCKPRKSQDGMSLPIVPGGRDARLELCVAMHVGTDAFRTTFATKGFPRLKGPLTGGGSSSEKRLKQHIETTTGLGRELERFFRFYKSRRLVKPTPWFFPKIPRYLNFVRQQRYRGWNAFNWRFDVRVGAVCAGAIGFASVTDWLLDAPIPELWWPVDAGPLITNQRFARDMPDAYRIMSVVKKDPNRRIGIDYFKESGHPHFAYAQSGVFNPDGSSLFSQNWRHELMPSTRFDNPALAANKLDAQAPDDFGALIKMLEAMDTGSGFARVHAH